MMAKKKRTVKQLLDGAGDGSGYPTAGEYRNGLDALLMGDNYYPEYGYRPCELRQRIEDLLEIEANMKKLKKMKIISEWGCGRYVG